MFRQVCAYILTDVGSALGSDFLFGHPVINLHINDCTFNGHYIMKKISIILFAAVAIILSSCYSRTCPTYSKGLQEVPKGEVVQKALEARV